MEYFDIDPSFFEPSPWIQVVGKLKAPEFHWHFAQGIRAIAADLYIPGCLSLLTGIEASLRFTLFQLNNSNFPFDESLGATLSNALILKASKAGIPVQSLAFPSESEFLKNIESRSPYVEVVRVRHNLAHGNIQEYVNRDLGDNNAFFTPECLCSLASQLEAISNLWINQLADFRANALKTNPAL